MSHMRLRASSLPLVALALALTANALSITNIFPYAPFMVKYFGLTDDDRELGFFAGFIMTAYMIGNGITAIPWGIAADRFGKRFVILVGLLANTVPQVLFGCATSFPIALLLRLLMGTFNGLIGATKALAPELVPPSQQASVMSMIAATWGFGNLIGPSIGGLLSFYDHCETDDAGPNGTTTSTAIATPRCPFPPFLLPNLVSAALSLVGVVGVYMLLPNDRPRARTAGADADTQEAAATAEGDRVKLRSCGMPSDSAEAAADDAAVPEGMAAAADDAAAGNSGGVGGGSAMAAAMDERTLARRQAALVAFYGCIALNDIVHNEIFPLWCVAPAASGGLGLDAPTLGSVLSLSGLALLGYQLLLFPILSRRVPLTRLCRLATAASGVLYALLPFVTLFDDPSRRADAATAAADAAAAAAAAAADADADADAAATSTPLPLPHAPASELPAPPLRVFAVLLLQQTALRWSLGTSFTCTFTILNNSVPPSRRGRMQGVAMTVGSAARAVGPTLGAELLAWSLTNGLPPPLDVHLVPMLLLAFSAAPVAIAAAFFSPALDRPMGAGAGDGEGDGNGAGAASMRTSSTSNLGGGAKRPPDADTELAQA